MITVHQPINTAPACVWFEAPERADLDVERGLITAAPESFTLSLPIASTAKTERDRKIMGLFKELAALLQEEQ